MRPAFVGTYTCGAVHRASTPAPLKMQAVALCQISQWTRLVTALESSVLNPFIQSLELLVSSVLCVVGFVEEMRIVAMKLHTKDQAPKEGGKEASPKPMSQVIISDPVLVSPGRMSSTDPKSVWQTLSSLSSRLALLPLPNTDITFNLDGLLAVATHTPGVPKFPGRVQGCV